VRLKEAIVTAAESHDLELVLESVVGETTDVLVLELRRPDAGALPTWAPGAHIDLILPSGKIRQYSLCGDVADAARYRVAVLREMAGRGGSEEIHAVAKAGLTIRARGPRNHFALVDAPRYLFLAGGIGITPMLPMIRQAESAGRPWRLVYGGRTRASMGFLKEIATRTGGAVTLLPQDEVGLPDLHALLSEAEPDVAIYGCGPAAMLKALKEAAAEQGCTSALHIESFSAPEDTPPPAGAAADAPFEVELRKSGVVLQVPADRSLGDVLQEAGIDVPFSCQEGYCGTCETRVLEGVPDHRDTILNEEEKAAGNLMMVCCGRSRTPRLVLEL
jgi:ferredoxin-NADP reductase